MMLVGSAIFLTQYFRYRNWSVPPGLTSPIQTLLKLLSLTILCALILMLVNRRLRDGLSNETTIIWLVLAATMVTNGLLIETYSWSNPTHHGYFAQHDWLGVAVYSGWTHNWTFGYTLFRGVNNALIILGITIISVISSAPKKM